MRTLLASLVFIVACGGGSSKSSSGTTNNVQAPVDPADTAAETCCCKSNPMTSEDGQPVYENGNRMECSSKQGECVDDVQCTQSSQPE